MGWLSNIGFLPASGDSMEAFGWKGKFHHFGKKILEQKSGRGGVGWDERSLFLQEERCRLLGKDFVLKPNPVLIFINVFLILAIIFDVILNIFLFSGKEWWVLERQSSLTITRREISSIGTSASMTTTSTLSTTMTKNQVRLCSWMSNCAVFKGFLKDLEWEFRCHRSVPILNEPPKMQSSSFNPSETKHLLDN